LLARALIELARRVRARFFVTNDATARLLPGRTPQAANGSHPHGALVASRKSTNTQGP